MSIYPDKERHQFIFDFDRRVSGKRIRARKRLPKTWNRAQADAFDRQESARLYAIGSGIERHRATIEQAVELYLGDKQHLKSIVSAGHHIAGAYWAYRGRYIDELPAVAAEIIKRQAGKFAPQTIKNRIAGLRAACRWGWKQHNLCEHDPAERLQIPPVKNERQRYLDRRSVILLARECLRRDCRAAILIGFYSGMRLGEIMRAVPVGDVFTLQDTKNGKPRHIPIHPKLNACIRHLPIAVNKRTVQDWFCYARDRVGLSDLHFHDLRHSTASALINMGETLYTVGQVLGHSDTRSTKRYAHLETRTMAAAIGRIGGKLRNGQ